MDVGHSLNPAIDIGQVCTFSHETSTFEGDYYSAPFSSDLSSQVEGAFMQGLGLFSLEQLHYSPKGVLLTRGPGSYKIPAFGDIPTHLTVSLLRDAPNDKAIFASKVPTLKGHCHQCHQTKILDPKNFQILHPFSGSGRASFVSGSICLLRHQGCHQCSPGRVRRHWAFPPRQSRLGREDPERMRR